MAEPFIITRRRARWSLAIAVPVAGVLLVLSLRGMNWDQVLSTIRHARPQFIALAALSGTVSLIFRAWRWRTLLSANKAIAPITVFWGTAAGYFGNNFLPARAGELIRRHRSTCSADARATLPRPAH